MTSTSTASAAAVSLPAGSSLTHQFNLHGWTPNPSLSDDENYLDLVFLITRHVGTGSHNHSVDALGSECLSKQNQQHHHHQQQQKQQHQGQQGHMGALIVRPIATPGNQEDDNPSPKSVLDYQSRIWDGILGAATNTPLFVSDHHNLSNDHEDNNNIRNARNDTGNNTSDIHAEISALGQACKQSKSTEGCTAYITIHPCKRCFAALVAFGISRIVTRQPLTHWPSVTLRTARARKIEVHSLTCIEQRKQMLRINLLMQQHQQGQGRTDEELMAIADAVRERRKNRKWAKKQKKLQRYKKWNSKSNKDTKEEAGVETEEATGLR